MFGIKKLRFLGLSMRIAMPKSFFNLDLHQNPLFSFKFFSLLSNKGLIEVVGDGNNKHSFTVLYLVNSCGMSLESALSVSSKVNFKTPEKPDLVLTFFRNLGFTKTHISRIVKICPSLLLSNSQKTLLPKFQFLNSIGISEKECIEIVYSSPYILGSSLKNHLIPCYNFLKGVLLEDEKVIKCLKRSPRAFRQDVQDKMAPNIALMRKSGVPESRILFLVANFPDSAFLKHSRFNDIINKVLEMGFDPLKLIFVEAIRVLSGMNSKTWAKKFEVYRKCGWSKDETLSAFKKYPPCLILSEEKIIRNMQFFVHKMSLEPSYIAIRPTVMAFSLEKRIYPRCSVIQTLYVKGLLTKELSITSYLHLTEERFLEKYVIKFQKNVPQLLHLYNEAMKHSDI